jgi:ABC-type Fe3+/spermidine/putrescine transport system ATPase subunit
MQVGSPREVYQSPNSQFVAEFIGETNFVSASQTPCGFETAFGTLESDHKMSESNVVCSLRPEAIKVVDSPVHQNGFSGTRVETIYLGEVAQHKIKVADDLVLRVTEVNPRHLGDAGDELHMSIDPCDVVPLA